MMTRLSIKKIEIQGFRSYGPEPQVVEIEAPIAVFWGPNSKGKTSFAESLEFLLTGQTVKREILSSRQDEFADALRHAHLDDGIEAYTLAVVVCADGSAHTIKRLLKKDYSKQGDCETELFIDGNKAAEADLAALGLVLSQPPLRAPVLAQHTLNYLFTTKPSDRASYFKALLEVTDLDEFRSAVAGLEDELAAIDEPALQKLLLVRTIQGVAQHIPKFGLENQATLDKAFLDAAGAMLQAEAQPVASTLSERTDAIEALLADKRSRTFPLQLFARAAFQAPSELAEDTWQKLDDYVAEKDKVDEETRRLTALFFAALELPTVSDADDVLECPLCGYEDALTPERIAFIRDSVANTQAFQEAEKLAIVALRAIQSKVTGFENAADAALPRFLKQQPGERRRAGFTVARIRELLPDDAEEILLAWLAALKSLARLHCDLAAHIVQLDQSLQTLIETPSDLQDKQPLTTAFDLLVRAASQFQQAERAYSGNQQALHEALKVVIDERGDTTRWQEFIDLARDLPGLRSAIVDDLVKEKARKELKAALRQVDKGIDKVLDEKFGALSKVIDEWWNRLRGSEATFFSAVKRRGRNTIDFKGGLKGQDPTNPKIRDVIAVFSDSQLHCLGLSIFLARAERYDLPFVVLDDPVLSSDEDYRAHFRTRVIGRLHDLGIQVIILTQHQNTRRDIVNANEHRGVDQFQIDILDPAKGSAITKTGDELSAMLSSAEAYTTTDAVEIRKDGGRRLRIATERFCKALLVKKRRQDGDTHAAISDYDRQVLGGKDGLVQKVTPYLNLDASHWGKLRTIQNDLNPSSHDDDDIPSRQVLKEALGNLRHLAKNYLFQPT